MKEYLKKIGVLLIAVICTLAMCACGGTSEPAAEPEAEEPVVEQDIVVGEYDLIGVTCEISDDIDSYLTASIDEELSALFGGEQLFINEDNSFERKAGDISIDSGTWAKEGNNTLTATGQVTMEFQYNDAGTVLVEECGEEELSLVGKEFMYIFKKK